MARVLHIGKPIHPPVMHGHTFAPVSPTVGPPNASTLWGAEVPEEDHPLFLIGEDGSPFFLDSDPRAAVAAPSEPPSGAQTGGTPLVPDGDPGGGESEGAPENDQEDGAHGSMEDAPPPEVSPEAPIVSPEAPSVSPEAPSVAPDETAAPEKSPEDDSPTDGVGTVVEPPDSEDAGGAEEEGPGPSGLDEGALAPSMAEYDAAPNKGTLAELARINLGLTLDPLALKRDEMLATILAELNLRASAPSV